MPPRGTGVTKLKGARRGWLARYRDANGREHSRTFARERDALAWRSEQLAAVRAGTWTDPLDGSVTLRAYADGWLGRVTRPGSRSTYETRLRLHVYPDLGHLELRNLRHSGVDAWRRRLGESMAPASARGVESLLRAVLNSAVADRALPASPFDRLKLERLETVELGWIPTADDVLALAEAVPARYRAAVILAADTGLRTGELLGLAVATGDEPGLNMLRREARVLRQLVRVPRAAVDAGVLERCGLEGDSATVPALGPPKTRASRRTVPVSTFALEVVAAHLAAGYAPEEVEVPVLGEHRATSARVRLVLQARRRGGPLHDASVRGVVRDAGAALRLPVSGLHVLRHHYASALIEAGRSVLAVSRLLGHATVDETTSTYGHLFPDAEELAREALEQTWRRAMDARRDEERVTR